MSEATVINRSPKPFSRADLAADLQALGLPSIRQLSLVWLQCVYVQENFSCKPW